MRHSFKVRIYYEDTDCGGVVYYANYLKYLERARTDLIESTGVSMKELMDQGTIFIVSEASVKYLSPGRYGDILVVGTDIDKTGPASILFRHLVSRESSGEKIAEATVKVVCVSSDLKPKRFPPEIIKDLAE